MRTNEVRRLLALDGALTDEALTTFVSESLDVIAPRNRCILFIIPDSTRSLPMPVLFRAIVEATRGVTAATDFLIALGTHPPMDESAINTHLGVTPGERVAQYGHVRVINHEWMNPDALAHVGTIPEDEIARLSGGLMRRKAEVYVNKMVMEYDSVVIVGPVIPHEVVGFSGGNKYFFPGVAGEEILNLFHWLGALITNHAINGVCDTPVRAVIDKAASFIQTDKWAFCLNVKGKECGGVFFGRPETAWREAADLSATTHIEYRELPFHSVLAMAPTMYNDLWVAGKCMYKLEPVVADGGELIIYAPHIHEVSVTHGELIRRIGYHSRDYFLAQMERFKDIPGGILAHSTHVRGLGVFRDGVETCRIRVTLASGISESECGLLNLGYRDPASIIPEDWDGREKEGLLRVPYAGEVLYRLKSRNPAPTT